MPNVKLIHNVTMDPISVMAYSCVYTIYVKWIRQLKDFKEKFLSY